MPNIARAETRLAELPAVALCVDDAIFRAQIDFYINEIRRTVFAHRVHGF